MLYCSKKTLQFLAAVLWLSGAVILSYKSTQLLAAAININSNMLWIGFSVVTGLVVGWFKAKYLFRPICIKNINRIGLLERPRIWQFYRIQFYFFLLSMIFLGRYISQLSQGHYTALITVATVEISLATALLLSSTCFMKKAHLK